MIVDPETGEVFEALVYPQLTLKARGALRREIQKLYRELWSAWWVPGMGMVDTRAVASDLTQFLRLRSAGAEAMWGEIDQEAVFEEIEFFLPKVFLKNKIKGYARRSPGSIRFNPYTHKIMSQWRYRSPIAKLRHLQEYQSQCDRIQAAKRTTRTRSAALSPCAALDEVLAREGPVPAPGASGPADTAGCQPSA